MLFPPVLQLPLLDSAGPAIKRLPGFPSANTAVKFLCSSAWKKYVQLQKIDNHTIPVFSFRRRDQTTRNKSHLASCPGSPSVFKTICSRRADFDQTDLIK